ncbi:MAG: RNA-directed DNA polymerase [Mucilaginibacter sp.]
MLKKDIYDDWYCDLQNYTDVFKEIPKVTALINERINKGRGIYIAGKSILFNIPKSNGGFRYSLELSPLDRLAYHIFGFQLIDLLDRVLPYNILSHRKSHDDETLYKPMIEQWSKFINYTRICGKDSYILETDLSNYYDNIDIYKLREELINAASEAKLPSDEFIHCMYLIESVYSILKNLSFDGKKGLPQNRDVSSFLANIYMRPLDNCLKDVDYFRYMDDIRIIAKSRADANRYMLIVIQTLRKYGLAINSSKTKILSPGDDEHTSFCNDIDFEAKKIDAMINSGKRKYVLESFHEIYQKVIEFLEQKNIHERSYRFYANRLITFLNAKDICVPRKYKIELSKKLIGGIDSRPDCADQICALAQAIGPHKRLQENLVQWVTNSDNLTFEWAVYSVIKTIIMQNYKSSPLQKFCKEHLISTSAPESIRGISAVYLNQKAKNEIINLISKDNSFFLQRHFIIALSMTEPGILMKKNWADKVLPDFRGHHRALYNSSLKEDFSYVRQSERLSQRILIKELSNYA